MNEGNRSEQVTVGFPIDPKKRGGEVLGIKVRLEGCMFGGLVNFMNATEGFEVILQVEGVLQYDYE